MTQQRPPDVGSRVEALRRDRDLSMRGLAELCDLSPNTISLIERGISSPSVSTLHRLAVALEVPITAFFQETREPVELVLSRRGDRHQSVSAGASMEGLGAGLQDQTMDPFVVRLEPGADSGPGTIVHEGHEFIFCLTGEIEYEVDGQPHRLAAGDALLFEARLGHRWRNAQADPAEFLLVIHSHVGSGLAAQHVQP